MLSRHVRTKSQLLNKWGLLSTVSETTILKPPKVTKREWKECSVFSQLLVSNFELKIKMLFTQKSRLQRLRAGLLMIEFVNDSVS